MIYAPRSFFLLANQSLGGVCNDSRAFRAHFGTSIDVCSLLWDGIRADTRFYRYIQPRHLLWALLFLKTYNTEDVLSSRVGTTPKTFRKWVWKVLRLIQRMKPKVVRRTRRLVHWIEHQISQVAVILYRSSGQTERNMEAVAIDGAWLRWMAQTFASVNPILSLQCGTPINSRALAYDTKLLFPSMGVISSILMDLFLVEVTLISPFFEWTLSTSLDKAKWLKQTVATEENQPKFVCQWTTRPNDRSGKSPWLVRDKRRLIGGSSSLVSLGRGSVTILLFMTFPFTRQSLRLSWLSHSSISTVGTLFSECVSIKLARKTSCPPFV